MRAVNIFMPSGEVLNYEKGKDNVVGIWDQSDEGYPVVRIVFDDNSFKVYRGFPYELTLPPKAAEGYRNRQSRYPTAMDSGHLPFRSSDDEPGDHTL